MSTSPRPARLREIAWDCVGLRGIAWNCAGLRALEAWHVPTVARTPPRTRRRHPHLNRLRDGAELGEALLDELEGICTHGRLDAAQLAHLVRVRVRVRVRVGVRVRVRVRTEWGLGLGLRVALTRPRRRAHHRAQPQQHGGGAALVRK